MAQTEKAPQHALREAAPALAPSGLDQGEVSDLANPLLTAVEALVASKVVSNISTASKKVPSEEQPRSERGSKLEYKRVDEA